jgi:hypothetical protein
VSLTPQTIRLAAGAPVHVDAASPDATVLAEQVRPVRRIEGRPAEPRNEIRAAQAAQIMVNPDRSMETDEVE